METLIGLICATILGASLVFLGDWLRSRRKIKYELETNTNFFNGLKQSTGSLVNILIDNPWDGVSEPNIRIMDLIQLNLDVYYSNMEKIYTMVENIVANDLRLYFSILALSHRDLNYCFNKWLDSEKTIPQYNNKMTVCMTDLRKNEDNYKDIFRGRKSSS